MSDISENEEDDVPTQKPVKVVYTHKTRQLVEKKLGGGGGESGEDEAVGSDFEEFYDQDGLVQTKKRRAAEPEEDDFARQLRLEREEAERKAAAKTKIDADGTEYEWDDAVKGWFPKLPDQKFIEYQQVYTAATAAAAAAAGGQAKAQYAKPLANTFYLFNGAFFKWDFEKDAWASADASVYSYIDYLTGIKYEWNVEANEWKPAAEQPNKPSAVVAATTEPKQTGKKEAPAAAVAKKEGWFDVNDEKNTNVYVSGLPLDISDEEFEEMMSKYGIIMKDPSTHKLKLKLYRDDVNNEPKGDGRCCYLMPESVKLCLQLLDGSTYKDHVIKVEKAKFEMKGSYDPSKAAVNVPKSKKLNKTKEKKLIEKQRQKLLDWDDRPEIVRGKHEKVVVIKNLFAPDSFRGNVNLVRKLVDDLKAELETYGSVKKVLVHEHNPEGVATVSFKEVEMADECIQYLNNRVWRNGRIITCEQWDGETKYDMEEDEETQQRRIDEWHRFLEEDEDDEEAAQAQEAAGDQAD